MTSLSSKLVCMLRYGNIKIMNGSANSVSVNIRLKNIFKRFLSKIFSQYIGILLGSFKNNFIMINFSCIKEKEEYTVHKNNFIVHIVKFKKKEIIIYIYLNVKSLINRKLIDPDQIAIKLHTLVINAPIWTNNSSEKFNNDFTEKHVSNISTQKQLLTIYNKSQKNDSEILEIINCLRRNSTDLDDEFISNIAILHKYYKSDTRCFYKSYHLREFKIMHRDDLLRSRENCSYTFDGSSPFPKFNIL